MITRDDVIRMLRQSCEDEDDPFVSGWITMSHDELERFAALVAAAEREECAKVCEQTDEEGEGPDC